MEKEKLVRPRELTHTFPPNFPNTKSWKIHCMASTLPQSSTRT